MHANPRRIVEHTQTWRGGGGNQWNDGQPTRDYGQSEIMIQESEDAQQRVEHGLGPAVQPNCRTDTSDTLALFTANSL